MKLLFDFFPIILFFIAFKLKGIFVATAVAIIATFIQIGWVWFRRRKVDTMLWVSLGVIVIFGGATLLLHSETFIKWKPTVLYWLFAAVLLVSDLVLKKNLIRTMMRTQFSLPDEVYRKLNFSWAVFLVLMGCANLFVAYTYSTDTWVNFKLFGGLGLILVFSVVQGLMLSKYLNQGEQK